MNSLGFSENNALSTSKRVGFESSKNPEKCIEFFEPYGLTRPQISGLVRNHPKVLLCDADKTISPTLEFLRSKGLSAPELASILSKKPWFPMSGLASKIVPSFEFFRDVLGSDSMAVLAVKRSPDILIYSLEKNVSPNIECLRKNGVTVSNIFRLISYWPRVLTRRPVEFRWGVKEASEMKFDASKIKFVQAVVAKLGIARAKWDAKFEAYKKWGLSEEEFLTAFKTNPRFMFLSLNKISASMEFLVAEMGVKPRLLAKSPYVLCHGLKKLRLRYSVVRALASKGLLMGNDDDNNFGILIWANYSEKMFVKMFVTPYVEAAPELLDLYRRSPRL